MVNNQNDDVNLGEKVRRTRKGLGRRGAVGDGGHSSCLRVLFLLPERLLRVDGAARVVMNSGDVFLALCSSKLSDGGGGANSGEKFRQPGGTKIRVSKGQNTEEIVRYL
jgi:hypothetical protein